VYLYLLLKEPRHFKRLLISEEIFESDTCKVSDSYLLLLSVSETFIFLNMNQKGM
jgi:hypothetical protein